MEIIKADLHWDINGRSRDQFCGVESPGSPVEASWMRDIAGEFLGRSDLKLVNDNQVCLANLDDIHCKPRNRHLGNKFHSIREEIWHGSVSIRYNPKNLIPADSLTNTFDLVKYLHFCKMIGVEYPAGEDWTTENHTRVNTTGEDQNLKNQIRED